MSLLDFNSASGQEQSQNDDARIERLRQEVNHNAQSILTYLLPGGSYYAQNQEYQCGDLAGNPGESLSVSLRADRFGVWSDFATNEKGGDLIDLWMQARKCTFPQAVHEIEEFLLPGSKAVSRVKKTAGADSGNGFSPVKWESETRKKVVDLGKPTSTWHYRDRDGRIIASVSRYDPEPGKKEFRPWDAIAKRRKHPKVRPLYNQPGMIDSQRVVLVEGEKCAEALIEKGICATSSMGGANAPPEKTDWSPLAGKDVLIWPDNDTPGKQYAETVYRILKPLAKSLRILSVPEGKPPKWDAADAVSEGFDVDVFLQEEYQKPKTYKINLKDWTLDSYRGAPPEREWLVEHVFPMKALSVLAASGGTGKGMIGLDLALKIVCEYEGKDDLLAPYPVSFGNAVVQHGSVVIFSAEDDRDELHRRLEQLDPSRNRERSNHKLILVPLPNTGGPSPLIVSGKTGPETTPFFEEVKEQLLEIPNLKMVIFDPLSSFAMVDLVKNPTDCVFVNGALASLASDTKAAIIASHHLNKIRADRPIMSPGQALEMISGSARIVDGTRMSYCIWPMDPQGARLKCKRLGINFRHDLIFSGCPVKANLPVDRAIKTFMRSENGLLVVIDDALRAVKTTHDDRLEALVDVVARGARAGRPFTLSGKGTCPYDRTDELPEELKDIGKNKLKAMVDELIEAEKIKKCVAQGSKVPMWLDVPDGPFWEGCGKFEQGFVEI